MIKKPLISLLIVVLLSIILVLGSNNLVKAQSISTLNAEIIGLRTKVNRLESDVRNLRRSIGSNRSTPNIPQREVPSSTINNPPAIDNTVVGRSDPLFQRLATLVIELKEEVRNLDQRLDTLEAKQKPSN